MIRPQFILAGIILLMFQPLCLGGSGEKEEVVYLDNGILKAGFLPSVGGRMVYLSLKGGPNLLLADSSQWPGSTDERPAASPTSGWKAYNGHIIWPGPQSQWWTHQDLNPQRRDAGARWPPDPYLIYAPYGIEHLDGSSVILSGPASPVSGIRFTKEYRLSGNQLSVKVTMTNTADRAVSWGLWSNARFLGNTLYFIPGSEKGLLRIDSDQSGRAGKLVPLLMEGYFTLQPGHGFPEKGRAYAKAFLHPDPGLDQKIRMAAIREGAMVIISFDPLERSAIHQEQALVEVYQQILDEGAGILELEHHGAYTELSPGEHTVLEETWTLLEAPDALSWEESIEFYQNLFL
jgi:hypothetical protein